jgi:hypothetical protein
MGVDFKELESKINDCAKTFVEVEIVEWYNID